MTRLGGIVFAVSLGAYALSAQQLATVQISRAPAGPTVPKDFIGISFQQDVALQFFGPSSSANTVLFTLMRNLGSGTMRIGGNAADYSCWGGEPAPLSALCQYTLTSSDFDSWANASSQTGWPMILGVNLVQNAGVGAPQYTVDEVTQGILPQIALHPKSSLLALELGNEINLYYLNPAYRTPDYGVPGETNDLLNYIGALKANTTTQPIPLAAPAYYNPSQTTVTSQLDPLLANIVQCSTCSTSNLGLVTLHEYPLSTAQGPPGIAQLLADSLIQKIEGRFHKAVSDMSRLFKMNVQIDETNSTIPDPGQTGVSDVQASALWALDYALDMARIGVRRVNFHIHQGSYYNPIMTSNMGGSFANQVQPEYYGMYSFLPAKGKKFMPVTVTSSANIRAYALSTCSTCAITVFLINKDLSAFGSVQVTLSAPATSATYYELSAPSLSSPVANVAVGGVQFGGTTGVPSGPIQTIPIQPDNTGAYTVTLDNASAGVLTIQP